MELIMRLMHIKEAQIGIMTSSPVALQIMTEAAENYEGISVCALPPVYPQGAEKVLVYHTSGRIIQENQTAADVGVLVLNASTCAFLYQYSQTGVPLIERVVTVSGAAVQQPCNLRVPIGTPVQDLLQYAHYDPQAADKLLCGGMMMGACITDLRTPVTKIMNGLTAVKARREHKPSNCIRCGACMRICPMKLMPMELARFAEAQKTNKLLKYHADLCLNCGCCTYVCPAHRPLAELIHDAKLTLDDLRKEMPREE
jgi:electron transport complex protein RnfC